jgi:HD-like signal output (HDOD) protein
MTTHNAQKILSSVAIPARPEVLIQITEVFKKEAPDFNTVAQLISKDIRLSSAILQIVNSPFFRTHTKISAIQQAIARLGFNKILMLVRTISVRNACKNVENLIGFWDTANDIAYICAEIAQRVDYPESDHVFSLGLFHACGIPILMEHFPDYAAFYAQAYAAPQRLSVLEKERYGVDHVQISGLLCRQWFLASDIIIAVENHHRPFASLYKKFPEHLLKLTMIAILKAAIGINYEMNKTRRKDISVGDAWAADRKDVLAFLGLSETDFVLFQDALVDKFSGVV